MLICKDCPAFGRSGHGANLCFCSGRPTKKISAEAECAYGIEDYEAYLRSLPMPVGKAGKAVALRPLKTAKERPEKWTLEDLPRYEEGRYEKYDDFDAIEIPKTRLAPIDYDGVMGLPITVLDSPAANFLELFEISRPHIRGETKYIRILCRWILPDLAEAAYAGGTVVVSGASRGAVRKAAELGVNLVVDPSLGGHREWLKRSDSKTRLSAGLIPAAAGG